MVREAVRAAWEGPVGEILRTHDGPLPEDWARAALEAILEDANARIYAFLKQPIFVGSLGPSVHPPGSTAVLAVLDGDRLTVANLGDSRLYLLRDGALEQMTVDQDLRTELLQAGRDPRVVADPGSLGALTHSVGHFFFDHEGGITTRKLGAAVFPLHLRAGDRVLFCSDGVPDCLGDDAEELIAEELSGGDDPAAISTRLCRLADDALGADNITALVLIAG
jgi:protein phosphatase